LALYKPEIWGLGGWTLTNHHYYDSQNHVIHWGSGSKSPQTLSIRNFAELGDVYMGTDEGGTEVYLFDLLGRHIETRTSLMGIPIYKFQYLSDHKLDQIVDRDGLATRIMRDSGGLPTGIRSPFGQVTSFATNGNGKLSSVTDATGATHAIHYHDEGTGLMASIDYPSGLRTNFYYDNEGYFFREQKSNGAIQELWTSVNSEFQKMIFQKNNGAIKTSVTTAQNEVETTITADTAGTKISSSSLSGNIELQDLGIINTKTTSTNDIRFGSSVRMPTSIVTNIPGLPYDNPYRDARYTYSVSYTEGAGPFEINEMTTQESILNAFSGANLITTRVFNGVAKTMDTSTSAANRQKLYFDEKERVTRIESTGALTTNLSFNSLGQLEKVSQGASEHRFVYNPQGQLAQTIDPKGHTTLFERNGNGQVLKKTLPNGDVVTFSYTSSGQVQEIQTPNGEIHKFGLSPLDQIISYIAPSLFSTGTETIYSHDSFGQIQSITKPSGQRADFFYKAGTEFVERIETPQGNYQFNQIDAFGRPREVISPDGIRTLITWIGNDLSSVEQYDGNLRIGQVIRQFTSIFNLTYILGGTHITYNYDKDGRMIQAGDEFYIYQSANSAGTDSAPETASMTVETDTNRIGNYKRTLRTYQTAGETEGVSFQGKNTATLSWLNPNSPWTATLESFTDKNRQIIRASSKLNSSPTVYDDYQYDANSRLTQVSGRLSAKYDIPVGSNNNILRYQHGSQITTAQYDKQDRLLSLNGAIERNFTYSEDGEMIKISNCLGEKKFEYDFFGNLKKVILPDGKVIEYKLDAFNRRVARSVNGQIKHYYLWQDQTHLWAILKPDGTIDTQYVYGLYSQAPIYFLKGGAKYIVLPNERGDIRYVLNSLGKVVQNIEYDEYGMVLNDSSVTAQNPDGLQPLGFASGLYDPDTKLSLFNARSYDPVVGRWTSKDPIGFDGGLTNLYSYVGQDPVNFIDPDGTVPIPLIIGVLAGVFYATDLDTPGAAGDEMVGVPLSVIGGKAGANGGKVACEAAEGTGKAAALKTFGKGGLLNSNRYLRIGISRSGGDKVFRITGDWLGGKHIDLWNFGPL